LEYSTGTNTKRALYETGHEATLKFPRQGDSIKEELPAVTRTRNWRGDPIQRVMGPLFVVLPHPLHADLAQAGGTVGKHLVHKGDAYLGQAGLPDTSAGRLPASNVPDFEAKADDVIGLYLHPPQHAAVFCMDEKTTIQAFDRKDHKLHKCRYTNKP
jgi:hypothetical protein